MTISWPLSSKGSARNAAHEAAVERLYRIVLVMLKDFCPVA
ncbi:MAG: hypothetical protein OJF51_000789 [Nitrospira sp.]|nr:MAG: hypothetical protein OJF51_000789 [Nitrospira sp.]